MNLKTIIIFFTIYLLTRIKSTNQKPADNYVQRKAKTLCELRNKDILCNEKRFYGTPKKRRVKRFKGSKAKSQEEISDPIIDSEQFQRGMKLLFEASQYIEEQEISEQKNEEGDN